MNYTARASQLTRNYMPYSWISFMPTFSTRRRIRKWSRSASTLISPCVINGRENCSLPYASLKKKNSYAFQTHFQQNSLLKLTHNRGTKKKTMLVGMKRTCDIFTIVRVEIFHSRIFMTIVGKLKMWKIMRNVLEQSVKLFTIFDTCNNFL